MKKTTLATTAIGGLAGIGLLGTVASAEPLELTPKQMDNVTAGQSWFVFLGGFGGGEGGGGGGGDAEVGSAAGSMVSGGTGAEASAGASSGAFADGGGGGSGSGFGFGGLIIDVDETAPE